MRLQVLFLRWSGYMINFSQYEFCNVLPLPGFPSLLEVVAAMDERRKKVFERELIAATV